MRRLLLVDDDEEEFDLFLSAAKEIAKDIQVIHADGCHDVVSIIRKEKPDIVFLDINMPTVDGIDCLKAIRNCKEYEHLPVIMYSTSSNKLSIQQSYDHKANLYVVKSYSYQGLLNVLTEVLSIRWDEGNRKPLKEFVIAES